MRVEHLSPGLEQALESIEMLGTKSLKATLMYHGYSTQSPKRQGIMICEFDDYAVCYKYCGEFDTSIGKMDEYELFSVMRRYDRR